MQLRQFIPKVLPNGVKDELSGDGQWYKTIRIAVKVLQASDFTGITFGTNIDIVYLSKSIDYIGYGSTTVPTSAASFPNFTVGVYADDISKIGTIYNSTVTAFGLIIAKGTYADVAAARTALAGLTLTYQLAVPKIYMSQYLQ